MQNLILTLHIIVCVLLVILVLLQAGKEGMGVIFGGGNSSVFGSSGAGGMLAKLTAFVALLFVVTSISYTFLTSSKPAEESAVLEANVQFEETQGTPAEKDPATAASPAEAVQPQATEEKAPAVATPTEQSPAPAPAENPVNATEKAPAAQ